jgi:hypothetical protein
VRILMPAGTFPPSEQFFFANPSRRYSEWAERGG